MKTLVRVWNDFDSTGSGGDMNMSSAEEFFVKLKAGEVPVSNIWTRNGLEVRFQDGSSRLVEYFHLDEVEGNPELEALVEAPSPVEAGVPADYFYYGDEPWGR